jgi:hypothetical protein
MRSMTTLVMSLILVAGTLGLSAPARADFVNDAQRFLNQGNQSDQNAYEQGRRDEMHREQVRREERRRDREYGQYNDRDRYGYRYNDRYSDPDRRY